jgi:tRNA threonylcarbamoyladenosine modification (KEOPS) complex Cgi121 subunit
LILFKIKNKSVYFHTVFFTQYHDFTIIDKLRKEFPDTFIQALNFTIIYNYEHLFEILRISNLAKTRNIMCSNRIELDFLLRVMGTNQISQALREGGISIDQYITFVVLGKKYLIDKIHEKLNFLFGNSHDEVFTDKSILRKKIELYKTKYNNNYFNEENTIKFLTEAAVLVMK